MKRATVLQDTSYGETVKRLMADPIIRDLAREVPTHEEYGSWDFIRAAGREYRARGGRIECHIGGPAEAIREIHREDDR